MSKSDIENLNKEILEQFGAADLLSKKDRVVISEFDHKLFVLKDDMPVFFYESEKLVPTLKLLLQRSVLKQVVVDMGAVKFVASGADVMRPGIVQIDDSIKKDELVVVVDQSHKKPLCVSRALFSGLEMLNMKQGKVLKNIHWVGDQIWQIA